MKKTLVHDSFSAKQTIERELQRIFEQGGQFEYKHTTVIWNGEKWQIADTLTDQTYTISFLDTAATFILSLHNMLDYEEDDELF